MFIPLRRSGDDHHQRERSLRADPEKPQGGGQAVSEVGDGGGAADNPRHRPLRGEPSSGDAAGRVRDLEAEIGSLRDRIALLEENRALLKRDASQKAADRHAAVTLKLIEKTALSDAEIADILAPSLGRHMPEWVAYERRLHRERTTRH